MPSQGKKWSFFLGNTNSGDQNFLNPFIFIYHRDSSHYKVLKKISVTPSAPFAPILTNALVKVIVCTNWSNWESWKNFLCSLSICLPQNFQDKNIFLTHHILLTEFHFHHNYMLKKVMKNNYFLAIWALSNEI